MCARISSERSTNTEGVEKWATPTFLLIKNTSTNVGSMSIYHEHLIEPENGARRA
jgi:hypothetical protein